MEFGLPSSSNQAFIPNLPIFETFHQSPHGDFRTSFYNPFEVKHRKRTTKGQFKVLEKAFHENPKPNNAVRRTLAQELAMTPRGVQVWFQNRRAKAKNQKNQEKLDDSTSAEADNDTLGDDNSCSDSEESLQIPKMPNDAILNASSSKAFSGVPNTSNDGLIENSKSSKTVSEGSAKKQRPNPQSIKIATTPEQYEKMMRQHQSQRDTLEALPQQRKRSLESQLYYHQNSYPYDVSNSGDKYVEFRSRANSLPGPRSGWESFGPISATESNFPTDLLSPMSSYMTTTMSAPMSAVSLPDHLNDYVSTYSPSINSIADDFNNQDNLMNSNTNLEASTSLTGNIRRNSCPPEFIASFVSMGFVPAEKQHLATIAEDDQFYEHAHLASHSQNQPFFQGQQSSSEIPCFMLNDSLEVPFAKPNYSQQIAQSIPYGNHPNQIADHGKLKMRRLSEPRIGKSYNPVSLSSENHLLGHQDTHHSHLLHLTTSSTRQNSIPQYSSIGPGTLMRGHSMDSTNWNLSAKTSNVQGSYVGRPQQPSSQMNFSTAFQMNSDPTGIPLDGSLSSASINTSIPYIEDINYSIYTSGESFS